VDAKGTFNAIGPAVLVCTERERSVRGRKWSGNTALLFHGATVAHSNEKSSFSANDELTPFARCLVKLSKLSREIKFYMT
jgi:hypothetical protein